MINYVLSYKDNKDYVEVLYDNIFKCGNPKRLENIDLLIDGAFEADNVDYSRPWCGSTNQRYHFLTNRLLIFIRMQQELLKED